MEKSNIDHQDVVCRPLGQPPYANLSPAPEIETKINHTRDGLLAKTKHKLKEKYRRQIPPNDKIEITENIFHDRGNYIGQKINRMNKYEYVADQINIIHYIYCSQYEKCRQHRDLVFNQNVTEKREMLGRICRPPITEDQKKLSEYNQEINRQLENQRRKFLAIDPELVLSIIKGNKNKPIFLEENEIIALAWLNFSQKNEEICDHLEPYINKYGLKIED